MNMVSFITVILSFFVLALGVTPKESDTAYQFNFNHVDFSNSYQVEGTNSTVTPVGINFLINNTGIQDSFGGRPGIASDGTNFFVVWGVSSNIRGARVSQEGIVLDAAGITIAAGSGTPSVVFDGTNFVVIWVNGNEIYGARVDTDGNVLDASPIQLTSGGNAYVRPISIVFDGTNHFIVWRTTGDRIYGIRVSSGLEVLDAPGGFSIGSGFYPWVAFDGTNYMLAWHKWGNGLDIYGARVTTDGNVLSPGQFPICTVGNDQDHASIAFGGTNYLVVWHDFTTGNERNGTAWGARVSTDGTVLDNPAIKISNYTYRDSPVVVAFDGTDYLVIWHEDNFSANFRNFDTFGRRVSTSGTFPDEKGIPIGTAHGHQFGPRVAFDNNKFLIAWNDSLGRCYNGCIYGQILQKDTTGQYTSHSTLPGDKTENHIDFRPNYDNLAVDSWVSVPSPTSQNITSIFGLDTSHIYAVCDSFTVDAAVLRNDGSNWYVWTTIPRGHLYSTWANSPGDIWAVGWCWVIAHYNGSVWSSDCNGDGIGMGIWGSASSNIFAVGVRTQCKQYNGQYWDDNPTGVSLDLYEVWGTASNNVYAVGEFNTIIRYNGSTWGDPLEVPTIQSLNDIWGSGRNDIFVVGDFGTIIHYNGTSWSSQESSTTEHLFGVWGFTPTHVYAVGLNGTILSYDGNTWNAETSGTDVNLLDVWGSGDIVWAGGHHGVILEKMLPCAYPTIPKNLSPVDGATFVPVNTALDWEDSTGADSYDIYLGTTFPLAKVDTVTASLYIPTGLVENRTYYWKIAAKNACGEIPGIEWNFITGPPPQPALTIISPNGDEDWQVNSQQTITWTSTGIVGNVRIEYSTNNGGNWTEITASTKNDGSFPWTVPDEVSLHCLIRISETDGDPTDTSDNVFSIFVPAITVTSPNGYENWEAASTHNITWTSTGTVGNVKIEYSTNNGGNWIEIIASTENDESFPWTLPGVDSNQCLVRVSETDGSPTDTSDNVFTIFPPSITVTSPNGGENWQVNSQHPITWTSIGTVGNVKIEYSTDNGDNWTEITPSTGNDGSFPWTIPDTVSELCLIKVSETDAAPSDTSDIVFSIRPVSYITVTSPNGGENWNIGSVYDITWSSEGNVGNVRIEYSTNGGNSWGIITQSTGNDGSYNWNVPAEPSTNCLVRISETDEDGSPSDVSDAVFSIVSPVTGTLTLRSPNGGETWLAGSTQQIKWNSTGDINYVNIKYSKDNGTTWKTIAKNAVNNHSYNWVIPGTASDKCLVRVAANDSDLDPKPGDVSDAVFAIVLPPSPAITIIAPNGGEQLVVGARFTITWHAANTRENVRIEYSVNGGETWREIAAAENNGKYDWIVPDEPSENCLVRISETDGQPSDVSDALFSIVSPVAGDIKVISPNGGETWTAGSSKEIKWTAAGIDQVKIEYSRDHGTTWESIIQTTPNSGSFDWTVPGTASDECLVRITSNDANSDPIPADVSDGVFSIVPPGSPTITVIAPNGGEQLLVGSRFNITWDAINSREEVKIEYSVNGGEQWIIITDATDNNGDYEWLVPDTPSETCLVRISEIDGQPVDISDAVFSIVEPVSGEITVTSPNGGESWTVGSIKEITWTAGGINNVTIEYSTDYGTTWKVIVQTTPNNGSFDWTIPNTVSDECLVRVSSNDGDPDPIPSDVSDRVFSIIPDAAGEFRVTSPNGGEKWEVGTVQAITWIGSGDISSVTIDYSTDNTNTWSTLVSSIENSGAYDWTIPEAVSDDCLVRVSASDGAGDPKPSDTSDAEFSIVLPPSPTIRVITPNGGEQLVIGIQYEITWFGTDSRAEVKIEYSINGGETWTGIIGPTENDGEYDWLVPDEPSETCLVRISEIDGQPVDVSDAVFSIVQAQTDDLTVLTPNGGENLESGSEYNITWNSSGLNNIIIEYSANNGETWLYINKVPADNGSYPWTVPGTPSEMCLVSITGADSDENPSDVSDGVFTIFDPSQASIEVFTPNGGESLSVGEEYYITWASTGINTVKIDYSTNNGEQWIPIDTVPAIGGRFTWTVPDTPSESCLIRISGADSPGDPSDVSDAVFSITAN
jgi:hypothetical protein